MHAVQINTQLIVVIFMDMVYKNKTRRMIFAPTKQKQLTIPYWFVSCFKMERVVGIEPT